MIRTILSAIALSTSLAACIDSLSADSAAARSSAASDAAQIARGRYLIRVAGCNDCHTPNYPSSGGTLAENLWLTGKNIGFRGPWGTTYPANLRLYMQVLSEDQWVMQARDLRARPPMPWFSLRDMSDSDLRAIYRYVRYLGPAGNPAPAFVPHNAEPETRYISLMPQTPSRAAAVDAKK